jgi:hypothetical protein
MTQLSHEELKRIEFLKMESGSRAGVWCSVCGKIAPRWTARIVAEHTAICPCVKLVSEVK